MNYNFFNEEVIYKLNINSEVYVALKVITKVEDMKYQSLMDLYQRILFY